MFSYKIFKFKDSPKADVSNFLPSFIDTQKKVENKPWSTCLTMWNLILRRHLKI